MTGHLFAFSCPHCTATITHRGNLRQGVASCQQCGADYRIDVRLAALHGPRLNASTPDAVCADPAAPGRALVRSLLAAGRA